MYCSRKHLFVIKIKPSLFRKEIVLLNKIKTFYYGSCMSVAKINVFY